MRLAAAVEVVSHRLRIRSLEELEGLVARIKVEPRERFYPTFPKWLNIPLSKSSAFFKPLSICETLAVGMAIITP